MSWRERSKRLKIKKDQVEEVLSCLEEMAPGLPEGEVQDRGEVEEWGAAGEEAGWEEHAPEPVPEGGVSAPVAGRGLLTRLEPPVIP